MLPASVLIPLGVGAYTRAYAQPGLQSIYLYLVVGGITNVVARAVGAAHLNNLPLLHIYTILELLLLLRYYRTLVRGKYVVLGIQALYWLFPVLAVLNFLLLQSIFTFNSYPRALASVIVVGLSLHFFFREEGSFSANQANRWINVGLLQYFGSAAFMFAFSNIIYQHVSPQGQNVLGITHATLVLLMYLLFALGFFYARPSR
ncbi:hypothetical protein [Hymenobacter metallicola]|uniref:Uncharacterized protein n=1 Tax=Hymenobacter metallicola TaxID=2563114 RepID=A0A4Z0QE24_9BACT|nr:hypothetical protein [Hymenobacter metallicola]TGE28368.1 hypothetical protein E5K02_02565 [Hymenobacter metallicola]